MLWSLYAERILQLVDEVRRVLPPAWMVRLLYSILKVQREGHRRYQHPLCKTPSELVA